MSLLSNIISRLFVRTPKYEVSAYRDFTTAVVARLTRAGVNTGGTADYPRVEVHSVREGERLDKDQALRQVTFTVESISSTSLSEAVRLNEENLRLLTDEDPETDGQEQGEAVDALQIDGWHCIGILPVQLQDNVETTDSKKILYRILQEMTAFLELDKSDGSEEDETND